MARARLFILAALMAFGAMPAAVQPVAAQTTPPPVCPTYVPGQTMSAGCWTLYPLPPTTPVRYDPTTHLPTNMSLGVDTDTDQGFRSPPLVTYNATTRGTLACNNLSYRSDVVECSMQIHIKGTETGRLESSNGHFSVFAGPPACCNVSGFSVGNLLWTGFQYPGGQSAQFTMDSTDGMHYWYAVLSPGGALVPYNVKWRDLILVPDSTGGHYAFEIRGSFPPFLVCKNPSGAGCQLTG